MEPLGRQRFDLVIFDLDGVLVASGPCHARAYGELWARLGVEVPPDDAIAGQRMAEVVARICAPAALAALNARKRREIEPLLAQLRQEIDAH